MSIKSTLAILSAVMLVACGERDIILPGERLPIRGEAEFVNETRDIQLPAQVANADWTHRGGSPTHRLGHAALPETLSLAFSVDIGDGDSRRARITADPVILDGVIYTLDARSLVSATAVNGSAIWSRDLAPELDNLTDASGGGLAADGGVIYVTTGFGVLTAMDAVTGDILWTQDLDAPGAAAPTVFGGLVYVVGRDSTAWALETDTGRIRWQAFGTPSVGNFSGGAGIAATPDIVVIPFSSGEVVGAFPQGGLRRWSTVVSGDRLGQVAASISDIASDPVIVGDRVYAGNFSGRLVALNSFDGDRIWTVEEGAISPVTVAGGSLFLINDLNELVRLDAADGSPIWRIQLPQFTETRLRQQRTVFAHYGPVLAGDRLLVSSSDGLIRSFDPASGALTGTLEVPGGAASHPVVAGGALYVLSKDGELVAFR